MDSDEIIQGPGTGSRWKVGVRWGMWSARGRWACEGEPVGTLSEGGLTGREAGGDHRLGALAVSAESKNTCGLIMKPQVWVS